jgi:UDP-N-acetylmuramyl pentapeptide phosphotransferase/UDP-N-acetylglucosamine-1-phosphate transferase
MGDVGSTAIGFFFGILPLLPEQRPVPVEPVALALSLFVLDATAALFRRLVAGETWYAPHRTHLYQRPVVLGVGHRPVLLLAAAAMVVVSGCAALWPGTSFAGRFRWPSLSQASSPSGVWRVE